MLLNIPFNRLELYLPASKGLWIFIAFGILFLVWFLYTLISKPGIPVIVKIYLLAQCVILFNWPFNDPRFWAPVAPLIIAVLMQTPLPIRKPTGIMSLLLLLGYVASGIPVVGYMTYTSLNRKVEARTQAKGVYRNEYEIHYYGKLLSDTAGLVDSVVRKVLQRYD